MDSIESKEPADSIVVLHNSVATMVLIAWFNIVGLINQKKGINENTTVDNQTCQTS